jgi:hypothetical protein
MILNSFFGRMILPLGAPFGFIRKGPAQAMPLKKQA